MIPFQIINVLFLVWASNIDLKGDRMIPAWMFLGWVFIIGYLSFAFNILRPEFVFVLTEWTTPLVISVAGLIIAGFKKWGWADAFSLTIISFSLRGLATHFALILCGTLLFFMWFKHYRIKKFNVKKLPDNWHFPIIPIFLVAYIILIFYMLCFGLLFY